MAGEKRAFSFFEDAPQMAVQAVGQNIGRLGLGRVSDRAVEQADAVRGAAGERFVGVVRAAVGVDVEHAFDE